MTVWLPSWLYELTPLIWATSGLLLLEKSDHWFAHLTAAGLFLAAVCVLIIRLRVRNARLRRLRDKYHAAT